jgi:pyridoxal phosphate enzyme (YggS family)
MRKAAQLAGRDEADICLLAAVKYAEPAEIEQLCRLGVTDLGENRVQQLLEHYEQLNIPDVKWHFIGTLQTNKVKYIAPYITMIEAVDTLKLMKEIEKQAAKYDRTIDILLELHLAQEETKSGMLPEECLQLLEDGEWRTMPHVRIRGIMMMASNVDDENQIRQEFITAADFFDEVKAKYFADNDDFSVRSYGMSGDYMIAQECRSTMVRIGTTIFGPRVY